MQKLKIDTEVNKRFDSMTGEPMVQTTTWIRLADKDELYHRDAVALMASNELSPKYVNIFVNAPDLLEAVETLLNVVQNGCETPEDKEFLLEHYANLVKKAKGKL